MSDFEFGLRTRVVAGPGAVRRLGELAARLGAARAFVVTDPGVRVAGLVDRALESLRDAGIEIRLFDAVRPNPTSGDVARCREALGDWPADLLVGFGGGSSIDVAKGCAFVHAGGGSMEDYWGKGKATGVLLPLIAVPTTAGTGSEVQSFALIEQEGTHQKMACGDPQAAPRFAVLDPELTLSMPRSVTVATGLDTLTHALETAVTRTGNRFSGMLAREAFGLVRWAFPRVLECADDLEARTAMLDAATFAGAAIENSMLGAAHSMGNALTARYPMEHGVAVASALPTVVRFNGGDPAVAQTYGELAAFAGAGTDPEALAGWVESTLSLAGCPIGLGPHGVTTADVEALAEVAARQWTAQFNPRPVGPAEFADLFVSALGSGDG